MWRNIGVDLSDLVDVERYLQDDGVSKIPIDNSKHYKSVKIYGEGPLNKKKIWDFGKYKEISGGAIVVALPTVLICRGLWKCPNDREVIRNLWSAHLKKYLRKSPSVNMFRERILPADNGKELVYIETLEKDVLEDIEAKLPKDKKYITIPDALSCSLNPPSNGLEIVLYEYNEKYFDIMLRISDKGYHGYIWPMESDRSDKNVVDSVVKDIYREISITKKQLGKNGPLTIRYLGNSLNFETLKSRIIEMNVDDIPIADITRKIVPSEIFLKFLGGDEIPMPRGYEVAFGAAIFGSTQNNFFVDFDSEEGQKLLDEM